jgi:hypothetical protein
MRKLLICSFLSVLARPVFANLDELNDPYFSRRFLALHAPSEGVVFECGKSHNPDGTVFFSVYVEKDEKLYEFFGRQILSLKDCLSMMPPSKRVTKKSRFVGVLGEIRHRGYVLSKEEWTNKLLIKHQGVIYKTVYYNQVSNGESCSCWFEPCECLKSLRDINLDLQD